jgi:hypothetical protein
MVAARLRRRDVKRILAVVVCGRLLFDGLMMVVVTVDSSDCSGGSLGGDFSWVWCLCQERRTMLELEGSCSQG